MRGLDFFLQLIDVGTLLGLAEFFLDRLHLFVQVILALRFLHLAFDAAADTLLDLQNVDFCFQQTQQLLEA